MRDYRTMPRVGEESSLTDKGQAWQEGAREGAGGDFAAVCEAACSGSPTVSAPHASRSCASGPTQPAAETDPLLGAQPMVPTNGRTLSGETASSSSSVVTALTNFAREGPAGGSDSSRGGAGRNPGLKGFKGETGEFGKGAARPLFSNRSSPPPHVHAQFPPEKFAAYSSPTRYKLRLPYYVRRARGPPARHLWLYCVLAALLLLAIFVVYKDMENDDDERLIYHPPRSYHFLENRERVFTQLSASIPGFGDPANKIRVVVAAARRPHRAHSDAEYGGWRQASNVLYVMGEFNVADSLLVLTAKPDEARRALETRTTKQRACVTSVWEGGEDASDGQELLAVDRPPCEDPKERALSAQMDVDVFLPKLHARERVFSGELPSEETLREENKVMSARPIDSAFVDALEPDTVLLSPEPVDEFVVPLLGDDVVGRLAEKNITLTHSIDVREAFVEARFIKTPEELRLLKFASKMSAKAHKKLEDYLKNKKRVSEAEMAAYFQDLAARHRLWLQAYPPIVGAGPHAAILHYRTGENSTASYAPIEKNKFVLVDAAGEYRGYASDITRTISRKKHWSKEMREVYGIVKTVQQKTTDFFAEGRSWSEVTSFATETLVKQLLHHEFLIGSDVKLLIDSGVHAVFMPHGLGHPVGLDVHDPVPAKYTLPTAASISGYNKMPPYLREISYAPGFEGQSVSSGFDFTIGPGYVTTIEPGVYFIPYLFDIVLNDPEGPREFINWAKISNGRYFDLGGVRIEDVVVIDWEGKKRVISRL